MIYSAPTSGGKTLVSEILMLRKIALFSRGTIFFIVPFVALAEEKAEYLRNVWGDMFIGVKSFHGDDGGQSLTEDVDIAVCTIERCVSICICVCLCLFIYLSLQLLLLSIIIFFTVVLIKFTPTSGFYFFP